MNDKVTVELGVELKNVVAPIMQSLRYSLPHLHYADVRINVGEGKAAGAENGILKGAGYDYSLELHVRALAGEHMIAPGYFGISLGPTDLPRFIRIVQDALSTCYGRALYNAQNKTARKVSWGELGQSLWSTELAHVPIVVDTVPAQYEAWPLDIPVAEVGRMAESVSQGLKGIDDKVKMNYIGISTWVEREIFASTEGAILDQTFCYTQGLVYVVAVSDSGVQQAHYDYLGHQRGWETMYGVDESFIKFPSIHTFARSLARETAELTLSRPCPTPEGAVTIVTDPHYNTLLSHEIIGHPSELDRNLKMETAYAGRSWLFRNKEENMLGKIIGSLKLNAYSDPSLPGYGHYTYDHEGTPAKKVWHVKDGVFRGFMNSRQTSAILGDEPNGHWKANAGQVVPLIRMSSTVFAQGNHFVDDMIKEVEHGYYLVGHHTPSIAESRENFRISSRKVYEITNGQVGEMFRDGSMMADSSDYFMNIDAVGNDFQIYPIANCGKGQPMQTKRLGNGGPTIRSRAKLVGGAR